MKQKCSNCTIDMAAIKIANPPEMLKHTYGLYISIYIHIYGLWVTSWLIWLQNCYGFLKSTASEKMISVSGISTMNTSSAYLRQPTKQSLVKIVVCRLLVAKPLSKLLFRCFLCISCRWFLNQTIRRWCFDKDRICFFFHIIPRPKTA